MVTRLRDGAVAKHEQLRHGETQIALELGRREAERAHNAAESVHRGADVIVAAGHPPFINE